MLGRALCFSSLFKTLLGDRLPVVLEIKGKNTGGVRHRLFLLITGSLLIESDCLGFTLLIKSQSFGSV